MNFRILLKKNFGYDGFKPNRKKIIVSESEDKYSPERLNKIVSYANTNSYLKKFY